MKKIFKDNFDDEPVFSPAGFWFALIPVIAVLIMSAFWTEGNDNALIMPTNLHYRLTRPTTTAYSESKLKTAARKLGTTPAARLRTRPGFLNKLHDEDHDIIYNYHVKGLPEMIRFDNPQAQTTGVYLYDMNSKYGTLGRQLYQGKLAE